MTVDSRYVSKMGADYLVLDKEKALLFRNLIGQQIWRRGEIVLVSELLNCIRCRPDQIRLIIQQRIEAKWRFKHLSGGTVSNAHFLIKIV